jgi:HlyD family secretion protein
MSDPLAGPPHPSTRARSWRRAAWATAGLLALAVVVGVSMFRGGDELRHFSAKVLEGEIRDVVEATGTVSAVITVQVGSQVSGTIARLNADFNTRVRKGDVIALIAPQIFEGALLQTTADLANARANVTAAEAGLSKARSALAQTQAELARVAALADQRIESQQSLDVAKANHDAARASVDGADAAVLQAEAQVRQKEAAVSVARTNLDYTVIRSPIDGIVVARNVDVGQTVAASLQAPTIFTIAQDLTQMQVYAKVDESDVGRIRPGQAVTFKVDAFPKETFRGAVTQIRMNPTRIQNVVTYDAIIDFENAELKLFPGMTAYVTIPVATVQKVVKLPNAALRYRPPLPTETVRALYARYGIEAGSEVTAAEGAGPAPAVGTEARKDTRAESAVVWKLHGDGSIEPVRIAPGITDHTYTEVTSVLQGSLGPGDDVVTSSIQSKVAIPGTQGVRR